MTLFRTVFQNGSTPANRDEALDEGALRKAFPKPSKDRVLAPDPVAVGTPWAGAVRPERQDTGVGQVMAAAGLSGIRAQTLSAEEEARAPRGDARPDPDASLTEKAPEVLTAAAPVEQRVGGPKAKADREESAVAFASRQPDLSDGSAPAPAKDCNVVDLYGAAVDVSVPAPMAGRSGRPARRVKTRPSGANQPVATAIDPVGAGDGAAAAVQSQKFPAGWLVVVDGPGFGHSFRIVSGAVMIGRGEGQGIKLDFGDNSISRHNHAAIAYDEEQNRFYIGHGGTSNIVRRNGRPVLGTEELRHADLIRIGQTTLRFVALCGADFKWDMTGGADASKL